MTNQSFLIFFHFHFMKKIKEHIASMSYEHILEIRNYLVVSDER